LCGARASAILMIMELYQDCYFYIIASVAVDVDVDVAIVIVVVSVAIVRMFYF